MAYNNMQKYQESADENNVAQLNSHSWRQSPQSSGFMQSRNGLNNPDEQKVSADSESHKFTEPDPNSIQSLPIQSQRHLDPK